MTDTIVMRKDEKENTTSLYRRFVRHFRSSNIKTENKNNRFYQRKISRNVRKKECLTRLDKKMKFDKEVRLGKVSSPRKNRV